MTKPRVHRTPDQKAALLREPPLDKKPASDVCEAAQVKPSQLYCRQKQLFENAPLAFEEEKRPCREKEQAPEPDGMGWEES